MLARFDGRLADQVSLHGHFEALLAPVGSIGAESPLGWAWTQSPSETLPLASTLTMCLGGTTEAAVDVTPGPAYRFRGRLRIAGSARAPFRFGAIGLSGSAACEGQIAAEFVHPAETSLLEAMAGDLRTVGERNDLGRLQAPLKFLSLTVEGELNVGASLSVGRTFVVERTQAGRGLGARAELGPSYQLEWARSGRYEIVVNPLGGGATQVQVRQSHHHETARTLSIGAESRFTNVRQAIALLMQAASGFAAPVEALVQRYSEPSRLIADALAALLSPEDPTVGRLAEAVTGRRDADVVLDDLVAAISIEAGARLGGYLELAEGHLDELVENVLRRLDVRDEASDTKLREFVGGAAAAAVAGLEQSLLKDVRALLARPSAALARSLESLLAPGTRLATDLDIRAKQLLEPFQAAVSRYRSLEERLGDAIEAVEEKLGTRFGRAVGNTDSQQTFIDLTFPVANAETQRLYQRLLTGDFSEVLLAGLDPGNDVVVLAESVFARVFARSTTTGVTINQFGLGEVGSTRLLDRELVVRVERGEIVLAAGSGNAVSVSRFFGESRTVRLSSVANLLDADDEDDSAADIRRVRRRFA